MKIIIKDVMLIKREDAIKLAKDKLGQTKYFAAIYGKKIDGEEKYFEPILVDEGSLKEYTNSVLREDEDGAVYALYQHQIEDSVKDAPIYEIELNKGSRSNVEAFIDIPEEEIDKYIKERMIQIVNNPRLFTKYKKDLADMLEDELNNYANEQFFNEGRGTIFEDSESKMFEIDYKDLPVTFTYLVNKANYDHPAEGDEYDTKVDVIYRVPRNEIETYFYENADKYPEIKSIDDEKELESYIKEHLEALGENYLEDLRKYYEDEAIKYVESNQEEFKRLYLEEE